MSSHGLHAQGLGFSATILVLGHRSNWKANQLIDICIDLLVAELEQYTTHLMQNLGKKLKRGKTSLEKRLQHKQM